MNKLFFELIQVSIGNAVCLSRTPKVDEWGELYALAKKQSMVGVCFAGVQKLQAQRQAPNSWGNQQGELLYLQWMGMAAKIQQRNEAVNRQCVELQERLKTDGFRSYIMKGQSGGALYEGSLSMLRHLGDIDIYLDGDFEKILSYARSYAPTSKVNELEMSVDIFPDTEVEFHYKPFVMDSPKDSVLQRFFSDCKAECMTNKVTLDNGEEIIAPTLKFNLVHQLVHTHHHLLYGGVGLRQVMDYYFVLKNACISKNEEDVIAAKNCIHRLGLDRYAQALMWVLKNVFGMDENYMLWTPNEKDGKLLLNEIILTGNFGKGDERTKGKLDNVWSSFWLIQFRIMLMLRFDRWAWFWSPIYRIKAFVWRKIHGFK